MKKINTESSLGLMPTMANHFESSKAFAHLSNYFFDLQFKIKGVEQELKYKQLVSSLTKIRMDLQLVYNQDAVIEHLEFNLAKLLKQKNELKNENEKLIKANNF